MTFHWRKSAACDLDEVLDDLNPQMKNLEREIRGISSDAVTVDSVTAETVTTDVLVLPPITQPASNATDWQVYHDSTSDVIEVVSPGDVRGTVAIDVEGPTTTPSTMTIYASMSGEATFNGGDTGPNTWASVRDTDNIDDVHSSDGEMQIIAEIGLFDGGLFDNLGRGFMVFDTSAVPQAPTSGTITVVPEDYNGAELDGGLNYVRLCNYPRSPLDASVTTDEEYNAIRRRATITASGNFPLFSALGAAIGVPYVFTLSGLGLMNIHRNGFSAFAIRHKMDIPTSPAPTGLDGDTDDITFLGYDDAVVANRPLLTLNFT